MKNILKIALLQTDLIWENPEENRQHISYSLEELSQGTDIVLLPEMFTSGFTMNAEKVAEPMNGETFKWLQSKAKKHNVAIGGSLAIEEDNKYYNRFVLVLPEGNYTFYDKHHLFSPQKEDSVYCRGKQKTIFIYKNWKIALYVCYDLRFPVWTRNNDKYDVAIFTANFPWERISIWDTLLKARAIENESYVVGVNRVGVDKNRQVYNGHSAVYDCSGNRVSGELLSDEAIIYVELNSEHLKNHRKRFLALEQMDDFVIT